MEEEDDNGPSLMGLELEMYYDSSLPKTSRLCMANKLKQDCGYSTCAMTLQSE